MRIAVLLGLLLFALPGLPVALLVRAEPGPVAVAAPEPPAAAPEPGWSTADRESLAKLREVTVGQTRKVVEGLKDCEARAGRRTDAVRRYHRCARPTLAFADGLGTAQGRVLAGLTRTATPTGACRDRILRLSGASANLGLTANATLRGALDVPWKELLTASRSIRALAVEARRLARAPGWARTCRPRPPAERSGDEPAAQA